MNNGDGDGGGSSSSSSSTTTPTPCFYTGFESLRPRRYRTRSRRMRQATEYPIAKERQMFRFRMENIYRSYINMMRLIRANILHSSKLTRYGIPVTSSRGTFQVRIFGSAANDTEEDGEHTIDGQSTPMKKKGKVSRCGGGSSKKNRKKNKSSVRGKEEMVVEEKDEKVGEGHFVDLIFRHSDLYLLGFVYKSVYYRLQGSAEVPDVVGYKIARVEELPFGGSYRGLGMNFDRDIPVGVRVFEQLYLDLTSIYMQRKELNAIKRALANAVIIFCEALRFTKLQQFIAHSFGPWYKMLGTNKCIPKHEADAHLHMWEKYSKMDAKTFEPIGCFASHNDLLEFLGVLLRSAVVKENVQV